MLGECGYFFELELLCVRVEGKCRAAVAFCRNASKIVALNFCASVHLLLNEFTYAAHLPALAVKNRQ